MPKPPAGMGAEARSKTYNLILPRNSAPTQYLEARSQPKLTSKTKSVLWSAELLTSLPYCRLSSRLLDRALIAAQKEEGL